jgi:hypothetical protein
MPTLKKKTLDEPIWVVIHICMEAMLGISLYSKNATPFLLSLMFSLQQNWRRGQNRFCLK